MRISSAFLFLTLALITGASDPTPEQTAELIVLLNDVNNNFSKYTTWFLTSGRSIPSHIVDVYMVVRTATDLSYTTMFTMLDVEALEEMATAVPWYTSYLSSEIAAAIASVDATLYPSTSSIISTISTTSPLSTVSTSTSTTTLTTSVSSIELSETTFATSASETSTTVALESTTLAVSSNTPAFSSTPLSFTESSSEVTTASLSTTIVSSEDSQNSNLPLLVASMPNLLLPVPRLKRQRSAPLSLSHLHLHFLPLIPVLRQLPLHPPPPPFHPLNLLLLNH